MVQLALDGEIPEAAGAVALYDARFAAFERPWPLRLVLRRDSHTRGARIGLFRHVDFYSLYIVRGGGGVHEINGRAYGVARGDAYLMAPGACHTFYHYRNLETDTFHFQIALFGREERLALQEISHLLGELFAASAKQSEPPLKQRRPGDPSSHRLHLMPGPYEEAQARVERLRIGAAQPTLLNATLARHQFFDLLVFLAHNYRDGQKAGPPGVGAGANLLASPVGEGAHAPALVKEPRERLAGLGSVLELCEQNFAQRLSVADLARHVFLTPDHFSRLFRQHFGVLPGAYIRRLRMARAQELLRATTLSIDEIAVQSGFRSANRLSEAFRRELDLTPRAYRLRSVGNDEDA